MDSYQYSLRWLRDSFSICAFFFGIMLFGRKIEGTIFQGGGERMEDAPNKSRKKVMYSRRPRWTEYPPVFFIYGLLCQIKEFPFSSMVFNLYHALAADSYLKTFRWLNLQKLAEQFIKPQDTLADVFYFTAYATWNQGKVGRHKLFIRAQEHFGVKPIFGDLQWQLGYPKISNLIGTAIHTATGLPSRNAGSKCASRHAFRATSLEP